MKRSELFFSFLLIPVDWLMVVLAGLGVYFLRYQTFLTDVRPVVFEITLAEYARIAALVALLWLPAFALAGMYAIQANRRHIGEFKRVVVGCSLGLVEIVLFIFFRHELFGSRFIVLAGFLASIAAVFMGRVLIRSVQRSLYKKNIGAYRTVVFGGGTAAHRLIQALKDDSTAGFRVVRHFRTLDDASLGMLANIAKHDQADLVIHAEPDHGRREITRLYEFCREHHFEFSYAADVLEATSANVEVTDLGGTPVVHIKRTPLDGWGRIVKRVFDIVASAGLLVFFSPLLAATAILIKIDSKGPVFFTRLDDGTLQRRIGQGGRAFRYFKFRSMRAGTHGMRYAELSGLNARRGPLVKIPDDPRVTRAGKFIRRFSIDELPEFFLVFLGRMSLVGPRPHYPEEVAKYTGYQKRLLTIKPGVTGLAQISGRSDLDFSEEARLDMFYIENWSFWMDLQILLRTPWAVFRGRRGV
ncbi:MAG: sugar transferase [Parcubacteria group bacterium]|nr:sugar transferase [Parcubacteria group bacterium]